MVHYWGCEEGVGNVEILNRFGESVAATLIEMSPYLLFGFAVAGVMSVVFTRDAVERHLGRGGFFSVLKATLLGVPMPLCSCSVIPVASSLRKHGASRGATLAFLLSTPQTGVDSFFVTFGLLGPVIALFRPIAAFVTGLVGGVAADVVERRTDDGVVEDKPECRDECCHTGMGRHPVMRMIRYAFLTLPADLAVPMFWGLIITGVIGALVPDDFFAGSIGRGPLAMLVMLLVGIPVYVCATASVPIAAMLIASGMSPGAAMVFLISGPATNGATVAMVLKTMGWRTLVVYLTTIAFSAIGAGLLLDYLFYVGKVAEPPHACHTDFAVWKVIGAVVLAGLLLYGWIRSRKNVT